VTLFVPTAKLRDYYGSTLVGAASPEAGASVRNVNDVLAEQPRTPEGFGASPANSRTAELAAINRMVAAVNTSTTTSYVEMAPRNYDIEGDVDPFTRPVVMRGCGSATTVRQWAAGGHGFRFLGAGSHISNIWLRHVSCDGVPVVPTSGGFLLMFDHATELNRGSTCHGVTLEAHYTSLKLDRQTNFYGEGTILTPYNRGIEVQNTYSADTGDNTLDFLIDGGIGATGSKGIVHISGGGLTIRNKVLNFDYGYSMELAGNTSDLFIDASFEGQAIASILFNTAGGSFENVQIGGQYASSARAIDLNGGGWMGAFTIKAGTQFTKVVNPTRRS